MPTIAVNAAHWSTIRTVLLDMDGTLLDLNFDNVFFLDIVPKAYAKLHKLTLEEARQRLRATYRTVEGTLAWYDLDHWSRVLGMDIPLLKHEVAHLIQVHPQVIPFLERLRASGRGVHLVTNAHARSLALKLARTPIGAYLDSVLTSHELGFPKEDPTFWPLLEKRLGFDPATTLLVDDSEPVLRAAAAYGLGYLVHIAAPSTQLPPRFSQEFYSIQGFSPLLAMLRDDADT